MGNLFAVCRNADKMSVRRIILDNSVNQKIEGLFAAQEAAFTSGINEEAEFSGDWKPDPDELLTLKVDGDIEQVVNILKGDVHAIEPIKPKSFMNDGIKGIAYVKSQNDPTHILIQNFTAQQILSRGMTLYSSGDTFNELSESAFVLDAQYQQ